MVTQITRFAPTMPATIRSVNDVSPRTRGARRCTNTECEYGGRWLVRTMTRTKNGKWLCGGRGCHTIYESREVIDPENEDYRLWVSEC
jgi:hypothetical protein